MVKQAVIIAALFFSINANGQAKKDSVATDATPVLSIQDLARVDSLLQRKFTVAQQRDYQEILAFMQQIVTNRVNQYNSLNKSAAKNRKCMNWNKLFIAIGKTLLLLAMATVVIAVLITIPSIFFEKMGVNPLVYPAAVLIIVLGVFAYLTYKEQI